ncbi:Signal transduction histidine kinase [Geosmithia morbida]|uniref:histidine kinase n=1 Tax=Geosmithia morbida TaxID=1094350 RepID=A0A9P4YZ56_9HYPO|nr:Signal transduction histidine kinase [Geosmithia morbida]KAF4125202.1 Signal transduction histidine kinase [Geosmithia morbida]
MVPPQVDPDAGDTRTPETTSATNNVAGPPPDRGPQDEDAALPNGAALPPPTTTPIFAVNLADQDQHMPETDQNSRTTAAADAGPAAPLPHGGPRFVREPLLPDTRSRSSSQSPLRLAMPSISPGQLAFSALQYLPVPTLVLNNLKTVVLANEAIGRMLGIVQNSTDEEDATLTLNRLRGQTLSQVGIDMMQDGRPVWVTWEAFLDQVVRDMGVRAPVGGDSRRSAAGDTTPSTPVLDAGAHPELPRRGSTVRMPQDTVIEVVVSRKGIGKTTFDSRYRSKESEYQVFAKMMISVWELEDRQAYFTLTFTNTQSTPSSLASGRKYIARPSILEAAEKKTISTPPLPLSGPQSAASSSRDATSPSFLSPAATTMSNSPFPPMGPPSVSSRSGTPSILQKMFRMKDALLDNTQMPILAMWKDGSVTYPNKAARRLFSHNANFDSASDGFDLLKYWELWNEDFTERLDVSQYPVSILLRTESPFSGIRCGIYNSKGEKIVFDVLGEVIRDDATGEFLAAVVTGRDITSMTKRITEIQERDEERFRIICDTMPQFVWTATPDGLYDFFNTQWYSYTGLKPEHCLGLRWQAPFHPDDMPESMARWNHSLASGEPYMAEYRCVSKDGEWRWFLARALAVRNKESGEIEKWLGQSRLPPRGPPHAHLLARTDHHRAGTSTDVHESMEAKINAKHTRKQLLSVLAHSQVTIFTADANRQVTMLEGALIWDSTGEELPEDSRWFMGQNVYHVFNRLTQNMADGEKLKFLQPIEDCLDGNIIDEVVTEEHPFNDRWYRTRFLPVNGKRLRDGKETGETYVEGVIGVIMDVTELRIQRQEAEVRLMEKRKALANEAAAKEATRLKSQFLANMSHEIRTPITGVLGMAELLGGTALNEEQTECVDNIHSSATSLLTVINDILDFSKVESGRLDIEEVHFSLSLIVKEVVRMLKFAVEKKSLDFQSDVGSDIADNMVVIGDPGRVRQIITNLLTNSIKFTNQGYVRFSVCKEKETADSIEVKFIVEDTGIGIQEEVRRKLFQPFSQGDASTARRFGGTGLGLTICKNLLDLMHGRITLDSHVGSGTTATFWIPFSKVHGRQEPQLVQSGAIPDRLQTELSVSCNSSEVDLAAINSPASEGMNVPSHYPRRSSYTATPPSFEQDLPRPERAKIHVLVVEDNAVNQKIATKMIKKLGFPVMAAWNGKEALEYLKSSSEGKVRKPDIILMDVQMPVIDGYKCTHLMRHHVPYRALVRNVPIVAMTASAIQGDREKCTRAGMDDYLSKPVAMSMMERMLVRWCLSDRRIQPPLEPSECSEKSEDCKNADIPHVGLEDADGALLAGSDPVTPRPLTTTQQDVELSPFDSPSAPDLAPQVRRPEGEKELSSRLQETKLIDAAGGTPSTIRKDGFPQRPARGEALTEENVNKLRS